MVWIKLLYIGTCKVEQAAGYGERCAWSFKVMYFQVATQVIVELAKETGQTRNKYTLAE